MTEYESERERLAMVTDELILVDQAEKEGKTTFTAEEIKRALLDLAISIKQHK